MKLKKPNYKESIMNVSNSILNYYNVKTSYNGVKELDEVLKHEYNHIIYVLLDGMGVNVINKHLKESDALKKHLVKPITSVFPPTTVAATNAVLSGLPPITTGYLGWVQYFKEENTDLTVFLNQDFYTNKKQAEVLRDKYLSYKDILTKVNDQNPNVITTKLFPSFIPGGVTESFKDGIEKTLMITHNTDKSFTYLYWTQPDLIEHHSGVYSDDVKNMMISLNSDFEDLINNISDDTLVITIADHGLTDIEEINIFNYENIINMLKRKPSIEPRAINFFVKDEFKKVFKDEFNNLFKDKYQIYSKQELLDSKLFGEGKKHELVDMFLGDYLAIAIDKFMFSINDSKSYKGHHAGLTEEEMMVPLIIYTKKAL